MLTSSQIKRHIDSCNDCGSTDTLKEFKKYFGELIKAFYSYHKPEWAEIFKEPVDVKKLNIPDYNTIITEPMDLGTVNKKFKSGIYKKPEEIYYDITLTFNNCMTYNPV